MGIAVGMVAIVVAIITTATMAVVVIEADGSPLLLVV
jgi:hypothetical protein